MAHEIEEEDNVVMHKTGAWHGLGDVMDEAVTPRQGLALIGADRLVECYPLLAVRPAGVDGGKPMGLPVGTHKATYYQGSDKPLGIVGKDYVPIQNAMLADFCEALAEGGDVVKCETVGSIRNGAKLWFLLKGESFSVRGKDEVSPYICASNGHDGGTALRFTPTTVRAVCSNTLHMIIGGGAMGLGAQPASFVCHHTKGIMDRVEEAKQGLQLYGRALDKTREVIDHLAAKDVTSDKVKEFFLKCYTRDFGAIPTKATNHSEEEKMFKAQSSWRAVANRFEAEAGVAGTTYWNAMNAYTGWLQNEHLPNVNDADLAVDRKRYSKLFGVDADRASKSLKLALTMAG